MQNFIINQELCSSQFQLLASCLKFTSITVGGWVRRRLARNLQIETFSKFQTNQYQPQQFFSEPESTESALKASRNNTRNDCKLLHEISSCIVTFGCRCVCVGGVSELEGVAEYSEPGLAPGPVTEELVTQRGPAPAAAHLTGRDSYHRVIKSIHIHTIARNIIQLYTFNAPFFSSTFETESG